MTTSRQELRVKHHDLMRRYVKVAALLPAVNDFDGDDPAVEMVLAELAKIQSEMDEIQREANCSH